MVVQRGEVWWADLDDPRGSGPGYRRPVLVVQADSFNRSRLPTVICVALSSNLRLLDAPGNVLLSTSETGLPKDSTAVVTQVVTLDEDYLSERSSKIRPRLMAQVEAGLKLVLDL
jgi:mRNA interferase MazF